MSLSARGITSGVSKALKPAPGAWLQYLAGLMVLALALVIALVLLGGFSAILNGAPLDTHYLGQKAAELTQALYTPAGLGVCWLVPLALLAGVMLMRGGGGGFWFGFACGGIWLILASGGLLALIWQGMNLGGVGGGVISSGLLRYLGGAWSHVLLGVLAAGGLALTIWSAWPVLGPYLEPEPEGLDHAPDKDDEAEDQTGAEPDEKSAKDLSEPEKQRQPTRPGYYNEMDMPLDSRLNDDPVPIIIDHHEFAPHQESQAVDQENKAPEPPPPPEPAPPVRVPEPEPPVPTSKPQPDGPPPGADIGPVIRPRQDQEQPPAPKELDIKPPKNDYALPSLDFLQDTKSVRSDEHKELLFQNSRLVEEKLLDFGVKGQVVEVAPGPVVTMYEFKPAPGVKISKVAGLSDDLALNLKARSIRIVAPIPGKAVIGIEIPSISREMVYLRELLGSKAYMKAKSPLSIALGKDILGFPVVNDLGRMPHVLIAGATGSGKSVFINTLVLSVLYRSTPDQVRLLMVDPKRIELSPYNHIPHLLYPVISDPEEATAGLRWAVNEMERRYELLAAAGVRHISSYNERLEKKGLEGDLAGVLDPMDPESHKPLPYLVLIIDELADLMMVSSKEVETQITRLAQKARAAGIHLVVATQRPSVDVITGLIKANFPSRISFQVSQKVDSRTILDQQGAENLLGKGDMLFVPPGVSGIMRLHGAFVTDNEIERVAEFWRTQGRPDYNETIVQAGSDNGDGGYMDEDADPLYGQAVAVVKESGKASISYVQRRLRVGYNRAASMIERMEHDGIVGPSEGSRPREVLIRD
jgi:S-DNA-T family DNA segregation ATPase FtsK/SpoIIIE